MAHLVTVICISSPVEFESREKQHLVAFTVREDIAGRFFSSFSHILKSLLVYTLKITVDTGSKCHSQLQFMFFFFTLLLLLPAQLGYITEI